MRSTRTMRLPRACILFSGAMLLLGTTGCFAQSTSPPDSERCGEVLTIQVRERSSLRYAFSPPKADSSVEGRPVTLVLLAGGGGHVDLDARGCARQLKGNSLVRAIPLFNVAGFGTALVDAPSDYQGEDGLGGFRVAAAHADDLGKVIEQLRSRTHRSVWVVGTSRGAISAANAAARQTGAAAPDGVVLTSALMAGQSPARKTWVAQSVFDLALGNIRVPLLIVGHADDSCVRSPPALMAKILSQTNSTRGQLVTVSGGPRYTGPTGVDACEGRTPHGFVDQDAEVAAGIGRFVRGGRY